MHVFAHRMLKVAKVLKSNGTEGEIIMSFQGILPEEIDIEEPVFIYFDGLPVPYYFDCFVKKGNNKAIARLTGIKTLADAEEITGADVFADEDNFDFEDDGEDFSFLTGWTLLDSDGRNLGTVSGFLDIPNNPCLEIRTAGNAEAIIPLHEDLIEEIDEEKMQIRMTVPGGLIG